MKYSPFAERARFAATPDARGDEFTNEELEARARAILALLNGGKVEFYERGGMRIVAVGQLDNPAGVIVNGNIEISLKARGLAEGEMSICLFKTFSGRLVITMSVGAYGNCDIHMNIARCWPGAEIEITKGSIAERPRTTRA